MRIKTVTNTLAFIILSGLCGFIFYTGWTQYQLDEDTYGIIYTKTSGWDKNITESGQFSWRWERLIPKNLTLHKFPIQSKRILLKETTYLASAELYAEALKISKENFKYTAEANASISINKTKLPALVSSGQISSKNYMEWLENKSEDFKTAMRATIQKELNKNQKERIEINTTEILTSLFPEFKIENLTIIISHYDERLYNNARDNYLAMINTKTRKTSSSTHINKKIEEMDTMELLTQYGEIFSKYPILIEYLKVDVKNQLIGAKPKSFLPQNQEE